MKNKAHKLGKNSLNFSKKTLTELNEESLKSIQGGNETTTQGPTTVVTFPKRTVITNQTDYK